ncbi:hypothetical protein [Nonomuraea sp. NPDC049129]|uniref:hypothetical protein n=1 Tax=Nonomuraea sp. NPDC049129 TaxID=3155272 RepID=UPI0033CCD208
MGALIAGLAVAVGLIAALVTGIVLDLLGADGVTVFSASSLALFSAGGAVIGLVQFVREFGKKS